VHGAELLGSRVKPRCHQPGSASHLDRQTVLVLVEQFRHDDPVQFDQIIDVLVVECGEIKA